MNDGIKKEIDYLLAKRATLVTILLLSISGTIGLLLSFKAWWYIFFIIAGIFIIIKSINGMINVTKEIKYLIKELKK